MGSGYVRGSEKNGQKTVPRQNTPNKHLREMCMTNIPKEVEEAEAGMKVDTERRQQLKNVSHATIVF